MDNKQQKIEALKKIINHSSYLVCICEKGMLTENGYPDMESEDIACETEVKYGYSPEEIFNSAFYATRKEKFFEFYKNEILSVEIEPNQSFYVLAELERRKKLKAVITSSWYSLPNRAGCRNVIELHGTRYFNCCPHCRAEYSIDYIRTCEKVPLCKKCGSVVRPGVFLYGEMIDNYVMTQAMEEIMKADVVLLCGSNLQTSLGETYLQYFNGDKLAVINHEEHFSDKKADLVIYDEVRNVLPLIL